jgi:hypothetical protein
MTSPYLPVARVGFVDRVELGEELLPVARVGFVDRVELGEELLVDVANVVDPK